MMFSEIDTARFQVDTPMADLCDVIQAVGTDEFFARLDALLRSRFDIGAAFVFRRQPGSSDRPDLLSTGLDDKARARATGYCATFFRDDPLFDQLGADEPDGVYAVKSVAEEIRAPHFRAACFTRPGFCEKLALARKENGMLLVLTVFCKSVNGGFSPEQVAEMKRQGTLLLPLIGLHARLFGEQDRFRQIGVEEMEDCVAWAFPELTRRETAVCARSILGVTSEGIALDLGIKQTSVLTYRRRAYARLNISSINQLSSMLIQSSAARKLAMAS